MSTTFVPSVAPRHSDGSHGSHHGRAAGGSPHPVPEDAPAENAPAVRGVNRRTLATGALWSVPAIAFAVPAPAYAASSDVYGPSVCSLYYPTGTSAASQGLTVHLGLNSTTASIPQGARFQWTVTMSGYGAGAHGVPTTNYSDNARWKLSLSSPTTTSSTTTFTVVLTVTATGVTRSELNCTPELTWNDTFKVVAGTQIDVTGTGTVTSPGQGTVQPSTLSFKVASRYPTNVNQKGRVAHRYLSKSGGQSCYPLIRYVYGGASAIEACGDNANSTSTIYPGPASNPTATTCVRLKTASGTETGQGDVPAKC